MENVKAGMSSLIRRFLKDRYGCQGPACRRYNHFLLLALLAPEASFLAQATVFVETWDQSPIGSQRSIAKDHFNVATRQATATPSGSLNYE